MHLKTNKLLFFSFYIFLPMCFFSQKEANIWYFVNHAGLDFSTNPPTAITNTNMNASEGCATISDTNGNLLFYTDGNTIWDKTHAVMANGTGLFADPSATQNSIIIKKPLSSNLYYVFTNAATTSSLPGLYYSLVDMNLANGNGSVTVKNYTVFTSGTEKLTATKHANDTDIWVLTHDWNNNNFRANLITSNGVTILPVTSSVGSMHTYSTSWAGYMKFSPDGKKLGVVISGGAVGIEIYDFNNSDGNINNLVAINLFTGMYGCEFSPDSKKVYITGSFDGRLHQLDLCVNSYSAIINSDKVIASASSSLFTAALQLGTDGKIYVVSLGQKLGVISNPNKLGLLCNYNSSSLSLGTGTNNYGLPNFITNYFDQRVKLNVQAQNGFTLCNGEQKVLVASGANSYTWNGSVSSFSINVSPSITTVYTVQATSIDGCVYSNTFVLNVQPCLNTEENILQNFSIFPNPADESIFIKLNSSLSDWDNLINYSIYNFTGKIVFEDELKSFKNTIHLNTQNLENGYYLFVLKSSNEIIKKQILLICH